jgi:hypothetical protein
MQPNLSGTLLPPNDSLLHKVRFEGGELVFILDEIIISFLILYHRKQNVISGKVDEV